MNKDIIVSIPKDAFTEDGLRSKIQKGKAPKNAISWSAENGYTELTKALITLGANITENHNYPLELASRNGHTEIVRMLLEAGASTKDSGDDEGYCLRMAAWGGHTEIVEMLLKAGADPTSDHYYAFQLALMKRRYEVAELLADAICEARKNRNRALKD